MEVKETVVDMIKPNTITPFVPRQQNIYPQLFNPYSPLINSSMISPSSQLVNSQIMSSQVSMVSPGYSPIPPPYFHSGFTQSNYPSTIPSFSVGQFSSNQPYCLRPSPLGSSAGVTLPVSAGPTSPPPSSSQNIIQSANSNPSRTLFIRRIPKNLSNKLLLSIVGHFGPIRSSYLIFRKSHNFILVSFFNLKDAKNCFAKMNGVVFNAYGNDDGDDEKDSLDYDSSKLKHDDVSGDVKLKEKKKNIEERKEEQLTESKEEKKNQKKQEIDNLKESKIEEEEKENIDIPRLLSRISYNNEVGLHVLYSIPHNPADADENYGTLVIFNVDRGVSMEQLHKYFQRYGEIKDIRETPGKHFHKFVEYYDVRDAEKALKGENGRDSDGLLSLGKNTGGGRDDDSSQLNRDHSSSFSSSFYSYSSHQSSSFNTQQYQRKICLKAEYSKPGGVRREKRSVLDFETEIRKYEECQAERLIEQQRKKEREKELEKMKQPQSSQVGSMLMVPPTSPYLFTCPSPVLSQFVPPPIGGGGGGGGGAGAGNAYTVQPLFNNGCSCAVHSSAGPNTYFSNPPAMNTSSNVPPGTHTTSGIISPLLTSQSQSSINSTPTLHNSLSQSSLSTKTSLAGMPNSYTPFVPSHDSLSSLTVDESKSQKLSSMSSSEYSSLVPSSREIVALPALRLDDPSKESSSNHWSDNAYTTESLADSISDGSISSYQNSIFSTNDDKISFGCDSSSSVTQFPSYQENLRFPTVENELTLNLDDMFSHKIKNNQNKLDQSSSSSVHLNDNKEEDDEGKIIKSLPIGPMNYDDQFKTPNNLADINARLQALPPLPLPKGYLNGRELSEVIDINLVKQGLEYYTRLNALLEKEKEKTLKNCLTEGLIKNDKWATLPKYPQSDPLSLPLSFCLEFPK